MDFLILRPLSPKTGYHFFEGGVGGEVGVWGGVKSFRLEGSKQWGRWRLPYNCWSNGNAAECGAKGRCFEPRARYYFGAAAGGGGGIFTSPGFEPPTKKSIACCITIRPLLEYQGNCSPLLAAVSATDKKPKLCVSV